MVQFLFCNRFWLQIQNAIIFGCVNRPESDWRLINGNDLGQFGEDVSLERHSPILVDTE